jgi:hypothetical protein
VSGTVCGNCGRAPESVHLHAYEYGHTYYPAPACPHGKRHVECDPCAELEFDEGIHWDETERTYGR